MEMTRLEKCLVNRRKKAEHNIARVRRRLQDLPSDAIQDALELGCGIGAVAAHLAAAYEMNVLGTDGDSKQIEIARNTQPESDLLRYRVEDAMRLTFQDDRFDLVISQNLFHHLADWKTAAQEVARVLRPGGYFMWLDLVFPNFLARLFQPLIKNYSLYSYAEIKSEFKSCGLEPLFHERLFHGVFVHHQLVCQKSEEK